MTLRRWLKKPKHSPIPSVYVPALREACFSLVATGKLKTSSNAVQAVLSLANSNQYDAAIEHLGLSKDFNPNLQNLDANGNRNWVSSLSQIGSSEEKQNEVIENEKKIHSFEKMGSEWKKRITTLWKVVRSNKLTHFDKLVAYGALFYLLTPIDFIPDHIPVFGLMDDYIVLGIAVAYYTKNFKEIAGR